MAQRGSDFRQILAKYFPGTNVGQQQFVQVGRKRSSHFTVTFPRKTDAREIDRVLELLEAQRSNLAGRLASAGIETQIPDVEIVFNQTTGDFAGRTGVSSWAAAATRNRRIELQPLSLLKQRGILETTLRHELVHVVLDAIGGPQTPRWLAEGMAIYFSGEGKLLERYGRGPSLAVNELEQKLAAVHSAEEMKIAYANAYKLVRDLVRREGETKVWKRVAQHSYDVSALSASSAKSRSD